MSTQEAFIDFFRYDRFETIILIDDKTPPANAGGGFVIYVEQEENFLQTAYMADEIMAPGNAR